MSVFCGFWRGLCLWLGDGEPEIHRLTIEPWFRIGFSVRTAELSSQIR
jgi:hypothetical protein